MKTNNNTTLIHDDFSNINTKHYVELAHQMRNQAIAEHIGVIKNVFKRKSSATKFKK